MTNETVKRGIKKALQKRGIDCNKIIFSKIKKIENDIVSINKIIISLNSIDGIAIDILKSTIDEYFENSDISYSEILLDI